MRVKFNAIDNDFRERIINIRVFLFFGQKSVNVDSLFFVLPLSPEERWIRAPNLKTAGILRLLDVQLFRG